MIQDSPNGSRSSSVRSVRTHSKKVISKERPSSALARAGQTTNRNRSPVVRPKSVFRHQDPNDLPFSAGFSNTGPADGQSGQTGTVYNQQAVYVAPGTDPEVMRQAATEVLSAKERENMTKAEAERLVSSATLHAQVVESQAAQYASEVRSNAAKEAAQTIAQVQSQAATYVASATTEAAQTVANVQASAAQFMMERERELMKQFSLREKELLDQVQKLHQNLADVQAQSTAPSLGLNAAELNRKIETIAERLTLFESQMMDRMNGLENQMLTIFERLANIENWEVDETGEPHPDDEEELVPVVGSQPGGLRLDQESSADPAEDQGTLEDTCIRWKDVAAVRMPALPDSAGALRSWKNAFLPALIALDKSDEGHLYQWLMTAFNAKSAADVEYLRHESDGFPRFDCILCSWFSRDSCLKGYFGTRIQAHLEEMMANSISLRGRPLLNMIVREYDLDSALGSVVSAVELFQMPSPESDLSSLVSFRDKIQYVLGQLPVAERPSDQIMSKWLFEKLKKVRLLQLTIDRIKESPVGSNERSYEYLWSRLQRVIAESQHEKNLASIQEGLKRGPKKLGLPGNPTPPPVKPGGKGKGDGPPKSKGKGKGGKSQGKSKGSPQASHPRKPDDKGQSQEKHGKSGQSGQSASSKQGACIFYPKGLCRRGADCPYRHEGPSQASSGSQGMAAPKSKAGSTTSGAAAKAAPAKAAMVAMVVLGAAAGTTGSHVPSSNQFELEWALDSGAGEDLASTRALCNQGVPESWLADFNTVSDVPLTFDTGGGPKAATNTVSTVGDVAGDGLVYMLQSCPYVKSLGKLIEKGFSFFWGPSYQPTLVPPGVSFNVSCDHSRCYQADRVDHCVPMFKETISFAHGMPASKMPHESSSPSVEMPSPSKEEHKSAQVDLPELESFDVVASSSRPEGQAQGPSDPNIARSQPEAPEQSEEPKVLARPASIPIDHLLTHQPAHPACDVCRQAKLRTHAHRRFKNQSQADQQAQVVEAPRGFLHRISCDHLEAADVGFKGEQYALVCVDQYSGVIHTYPATNKSQSAVENALRHFCRETRPIVASDRYPSILAAIHNLGMSSDPSPPNDPKHNPSAESAIKTVRQGTRSLLLQSGLGVKFWPRAMRCFSYQYGFNTFPSLEPGGLRKAVRQHDDALPEGFIGPAPPPPEYESKIHMALSYQPETRMFPFGALVWYLSRAKDPKAPKDFGPTGIAGLYVGPEVLPGMRCKDVHVLFDLESLTGSDRVREIVTADLIAPVGKWMFPLTSVPMLQSLRTELPPPPASNSDVDGDDLLVPRNRSITKRRLNHYGSTDNCDGCLRGTYSHSLECRSRFNRLLNEFEPFDEASGGGDIYGHQEHEDEEQPKDDVFKLFDIRASEDENDSLDNWVSQFPFGPRTPEQGEVESACSSSGPAPTTPAQSSAESGFVDDVEDLAEYAPMPGGIARTRIGMFIEFCCEANSACSRVANHLGIPYFGITKSTLDVENDDQFEQFLDWLQLEIQENPGPIHLWGSLPCTPWGPWQEMNVHRYGQKFEDKLYLARCRSLQLVHKFKEAGELVKCSRGGSVTFEWSRNNKGWGEPVVQQTLDYFSLIPVAVDGCAFGLEIDGKHPQSPWTILSDSCRLRNELQSKTCKHPSGYHDSLEGNLTTKSGIYNVDMAVCILTSLFPGVLCDRIPAFPTMPFTDQSHRERVSHLNDVPPSIMALIHRQLTREEIRQDPQALKAIWEEGEGVRARGVWDDSTVREKADLIQEARREGKEIHIADIMAIASVKHWESPDKRKHKGRLVFRGDQVKDSWGGAASFGELYSTPTNIQAINIAIFYGLLVGNVLKVADCVKAYLQALLLTEEETWVVIPPELWLDSWRGRFKTPVVRLVRALYGHPLASAFWDLHLKQVLIGDLGLEPVDGHPSVYMHPTARLLVVVYVDDVLCAGPEANQSWFWESLRSKLELEPEEDLSQFIGRSHILSGSTCVFDMRDYEQQVLDRYLDITGGNVAFRKVSTPYVTEGMLIQADYEVEGQISSKAASVLMQLLWLTRLARPDLAFAVSSLATQVTKWSRNADKQLYRLLSYVWTTRNLCMKSQVWDPPNECSLDLYADADLGGCPLTAKSTSGLFLVVQGPRGTFAPIIWSSRRQSHVARSTADAELNSLAEGLHEELLPAVMLLNKLLGEGQIPRPVCREDNTAVVQAIKKGYSVKLRHLARTPKLSLASLHEATSTWCALVHTGTHDQLGDLFTKALPPGKFNPQALGLTVWLET